MEAKAAENRRLIAQLRAHTGIESLSPAGDKSKKTKSEAAAQQKNQGKVGRPLVDPADKQRAAKAADMRRYRARRKAATAATAPTSEPAPAGWHRDENGNLSREHVSVPEHHPLTGPAPKGVVARRRGDADAARST